MMDWLECFRKRIIKEVSEDAGLIASLLKTSENKIKSSEKLGLSEETATSKLSLAYDSLREILEALALKKGYKIYNHECYVEFLREVMNKGEKAEEFDEIRKIRNSVNYYGKEISAEETKEIIEKIKNIRKFILELLIKI